MASFAEEEDFITDARMVENAHKIDVIVANNFKLNKISVPETTDDATFMRRATLAAIGRIPTPQEALQFLELEHPGKRKLLIDYLYNSDGYSSHMTNYYYDLFTLREGFGNGTGTRDNSQLIDWFRSAADTNMTWNLLCEKLLTTRGNVYTGSGAAGYFDKGDAVDDHLSNTVRIFTGIRLECAQCHDDPFQDWEQMDFYTLKAFVDGPVGVEKKADFGSIRPEIRRRQEAEPEKYKSTSIGRIEGLMFELSKVGSHGISEAKGTGRAALPSTYKYNDGDPGEFVAAKAPFGATARTRGKENDPESLNKFAEWMTNEKTPQFSITIANRMWDRVMGISLTPIVGDYVDPRDTHFKQLIIKLAEIMKDYDYDLKAFQKTLMLTRTFQFTSSQKDLVNGSKNALDGRRANRMSAEQIWDSLLSLAVSNPDALPKRAKTSEDFIYAGQYVMSNAEMAEKLKTMSIKQFEKYLFKLFEDLKNNKFEKVGSANNSKKRGRKGLGSKGELRRASEFPTPAGGFFATFGQSTRSAAIDEASKEGSVSQALELLNGQVQSLIIHSNTSAANKVIEQIQLDSERVKTIFLVVLNRVPDEDEMTLCLDLVKNTNNTQDAYRNIMAGLIASQEFYFIF